MSVSQTSSLVVDASVALVTILPHPYQEHGWRFWQNWQQQPQPLLAPHLWVAEVTSGLRRAVWERVLTEEEARAALRDLLELPLTLTSDGEIAMQALSWAGRLQQKRAYDAFYVALAEQRGTVFWSADRRLVETLRQQGFSRARWIGEI